MAHEYFSDDEYHELLEKRRELINLKAHFKEAKREVNTLERDIEAWQEKANYFEEELATKQSIEWYLRPLFWFVLGATTSIVLMSLII